LHPGGLLFLGSSVCHEVKVGAQTSPDGVPDDPLIDSRACPNSARRAAAQWCMWYRREEGEAGAFPPASPDTRPLEAAVSHNTRPSGAASRNVRPSGAASRNVRPSGVASRNVRPLEKASRDTRPPRAVASRNIRPSEEADD
ncbi:hypothetical protein FOZ62_020483, partial [Perkinsus olseni]